MDELIWKQDAIDALNEYFERIGKIKRRGLTKGEKAISLDTVGAIKTLPPVQLGTNLAEVGTNLVSKQAAIDAICTDCCGGNRDHDCRFYQDCDNLKSIRALPPVQPKSGEWEYHSNPTIGINPETAYCSCCGFRVDTTGNIDFDEYNFCPRCGVKMER